jgi:hypothetical protein
VTEQTISKLEDRRTILKLEIFELDQAKARALHFAGMSAKDGGTTVEETNARTARIAVDRKVLDSELATIEIQLAEMTAALPITLKAANLKDIISLFESAFQQKTPPPSAVAALDRLRTLARIK